MNKYNFTIKNESGRIDKVCSELLPNISRSRAKELISDGNILVNQAQVKPKYDVRCGDQIMIELPEPKQLDLVAEDIPLDIAYEDADVIVINKPQGMVVHPAPGHPNHTLVNALLYHTPLSNINGTLRPGIVHRIDKDTSGLLMVAKNNLAHESLSKQLKNKTNLRKYVALVHGNLKHDQGTIDAPIGRAKNDRKKQAIVADGRNAITHYKVLERLNNYTLVQCQLETGRTHQIRVHMKSIGHPLVGDPIYGPRKTIKGNGQFLHAQVLGFTHPRTGKSIRLSAPLPTIFEQTLKRLRHNQSHN